MTRDSIPRDDLYGELEVSRQASVAAIEAAYRRLVKQHHPDVARSDDVERIKRLNLAREWLTDLDRRRRYDASRGMSPTSAVAHHSSAGDDAAPGTRRRPGQRTAGSVPDARSARDASSEPARSFGVNANEVRIFLAGLRGLDSERARRVFDGRAVAHTKGYTAARRAAAQVGQSKRKTEWQLAREAASVIARGKLGDTTLTEQVVDVLADIAGAIAIRDLLTKSDYKTLLLPWTWKSARVVPAKAPAPEVQATEAAPSTTAKLGVRSRPGTAAAQTLAATAAAAAMPAAGAATAAAGGTSAAAATPVEQPTRRVSISDLGASPWQAEPESAAEPAPEPAPRSAPNRITRAAPSLSLSPRSSPTHPVPARPGPERPGRRAAIPVVAVPGASIPSLNGPRMRVPSWLPAALAIAVFVVVAGALLGIGRPSPEQRVAGITDAPTSGTGGATPVIVAPGTSIEDSTADPGASDPGGVTPGPDATDPTDGPGGPGPGATQPPGSTPRPTPQPPTPPPAPTPTPPAPPTQTPAPPPTQTPEPQCIVPNLIGVTASQAPSIWAAAGFTGSITFDPPMQPNQRIGFQSLVPDSFEPCSSEITVGR